MAVDDAPKKGMKRAQTMKQLKKATKMVNSSRKLASKTTDDLPKADDAPPKRKRSKASMFDDAADEKPKRKTVVSADNDDAAPKLRRKTQSSKIKKPKCPYKRPSDWVECWCDLRKKKDAFGQDWQRWPANAPEPRGNASSRDGPRRRGRGAAAAMPRGYSEGGAAATTTRETGEAASTAPAASTALAAFEVRAPRYGAG